MKPGLDQLISALTADGRPDELAGRDAALAAFRAAGQRARDRADAPAAPRSPPSSRPLTGWLPTRLAAIAAAGGRRRRRDHRGGVHAGAARAGAGCRAYRLRAARRARRPARRPGTAPSRAGGHHRRHPARQLPLLRRGVQDAIAAIRRPLPRHAERGSGARNRWRGCRAHRPGHRARPPRGGRAGRGCVARTAASATVADRGHRRHRPARRVQVRDPAADRDRGFPRGRTGRRVQRPVRVAVTAHTAASWLLALRPPPSHQDEPPRDDDEQEPRDPCRGAAGERWRSPPRARQAARSPTVQVIQGTVPGRKQPAVVRGLQAQPRAPSRRAAWDGSRRTAAGTGRSRAGRRAARRARRASWPAKTFSSRLVELLRRQPPHRVVLAQQLRGPVPVRVRGAQPRVTRHRARRRRRRYSGTLQSKPRPVLDGLLLRLFLLARGQHPRPLGGDGHRVLEVRGPGPVDGDDRPPVVKLGDMPAAAGDHRLDRQRHPGPQPRPLPGRPVVPTTGSMCISVPIPCPVYSRISP